MYSSASMQSSPLPSPTVLSSSLPPSFNLCDFMNERTPCTSASSLSSLSEGISTKTVSPFEIPSSFSYTTKFLQQYPPTSVFSPKLSTYATQSPLLCRSSNSSTFRNQSAIPPNPFLRNEVPISDIPDCSYFPFFVDPKLEKNIFDLPSDCDLQNYGVSLLDFLHKTFATSISSETTSNNANGSVVDPVLAANTTDDCSENFDGSSFKKHSLSSKATMKEEDRTNQNNNRGDIFKKSPKPVTAITMRQEPIIAQRACSRPVDKPVPQFATSFDINSPALNVRNSKPSLIKSNFDLVSAGQVLHKHLQQHLYNQSGNSTNHTGTKIITSGSEVQVPLKLEAKNRTCPTISRYQQYQKPEVLPNDLSPDSLDPVSHIIEINNRRGLAVYQEKERQAKMHRAVPNNSSLPQSHFYQDFPPRPNAKLPPYESHDENPQGNWSKCVLYGQGPEDASRLTNHETSRMNQRLAHSNYIRISNIKDANATPSSKLSAGSSALDACQNTIGPGYRHSACPLDGRDGAGYKTSCFCAQHGFAQEEISESRHFEDQALGYTAHLRLQQQQQQQQHHQQQQQLNGLKVFQQSSHEAERLFLKQLKLQQYNNQHKQFQPLQQQHHQQQQHQQQQQQFHQRLRQQQLWLQQQQQFMPPNIEPVCNHPECQEKSRLLQNFNNCSGNLFSSEDTHVDDDIDSGRPINVRLMLHQHSQEDLKQHFQHQLQLRAMNARQPPRIRTDGGTKLADPFYASNGNNNFNNNYYPQQYNGRIVEDFEEMILDNSNEFANQVVDNNVKFYNNTDVDTATASNNNAELFAGEGPATQYTSSIEGNEETYFITSPIPVRKQRRVAMTLPPAPVTAPMSKMSDKPGSTTTENSRVRYYPARAFKFYMEQHVEKVMQYYEDRQKRRQQLEKEMNEMKLGPTDRKNFRNLLAIKESNHLRLRRTKMDQCAFEKLANLGGGAFGNVFLVRKKDSGVLYAMKCMRKKDVWNKKQIAHVKAERDILAEADNRWVVKLYFSFQDADFLYLIMEYIPGGDLMGLLIKKGIFEHELAQFYIAELVLAIESVHRLGFIHRDIKPDNILINRNGHIKLTDFGLCTGFHWTHDSDYYRDDKSTSPNSRLRRFEQMRDSSAEVKDREGGLRRKVAKSLVGTPNYIAPEVLMQSGYTSCCDWWSVGVILYEMRFGQPPFRADNALETQKKVINWKTTLRYPEMEPRVSRETINVISRLCCAPENRLGSREGGVREIKSHPFFEGIDFETLHSIGAPYIPRLQGSTDLSNFDAAKPLLQKPELPSSRGRHGRVAGCKYERPPSSCSSPPSSPPSSPQHKNNCNYNFYDDNRHPRVSSKKAPLAPSYRNIPPRRSDSADSLLHQNGVNAGHYYSSQRHRSPGAGGGWGSRNGGGAGDYGADGSGGEESFTRHDFFDFTFRRFFDNESETTS